jgi:hypothetical protein
VLASAERYDTFLQQTTLDVWNLTPTIASLAAQWDQAFNAASTAFTAALNQIETNVEGEAQRFVDQDRAAEEAFQHWDTVDGKQGYDRFRLIMANVVQVLIPVFNAFLSRVPGTARVSAAAARAQQSVSHIDSGFGSFPNLRRLPDDSTAFPHLRYGGDDRKYGGDDAISALQDTAAAYFNRTGHKVYVGDMQYEHGGKIGIHKSHKNGIDADVDGVEVGDVGNSNWSSSLALALAKDILGAGPHLVFYADQSTITAANSWAAQAGLKGRLQYEAGHTKHFHMRMPV